MTIVSYLAGTRSYWNWKGDENSLSIRGRQKCTLWHITPLYNVHQLFTIYVVKSHVIGGEPIAIYQAYSLTPNTSDPNPLPGSRTCNHSANEAELTIQNPFHCQQGDRMSINHGRNKEASTQSSTRAALLLHINYKCTKFYAPTSAQFS
uniref:SFRICE_004858 n=1 Tax=Spodoptera frugiperda TaxID=7108 RepID=A0A2H1WCK1_SPOFR